MLTGQASNRTTQILQGQNSDLYVLSIPSFTWTYVGGNLPSQPTGRAAHTCSLIGSQMVVVGGYISEDILCVVWLVWLSLGFILQDDTVLT